MCHVCGPCAVNHSLIPFVDAFRLSSLPSSPLQCCAASTQAVPYVLFSLLRGLSLSWNDQNCLIYFLYFLFFLSVLYFPYSFTPSIGIFMGIMDIQRLSSLPGPYHHQPQHAQDKASLRSTAYYRPA